MSEIGIYRGHPVEILNVSNHDGQHRATIRYLRNRRVEIVLKIELHGCTVPSRVPLHTSIDL